MTLPSCRLAFQWMPVRSLASGIVPISTGMESKSPSEVLAAREKLMERGREFLNQRVMESIAYLDSNAEDPPDSETSGPREKGQPD